ncbi:cytochrome aa3 quinol oxidase subunit II [Paenibacillus crassostreae]|uniref:Quinol oxidase polypeptide II n=1 Tax=Paenibacillus crassostreae TaxID=1763538 RepID=A0A167G3A2_9BACL|nr:cytochrome aa3 quinol oxidase subunit II [Paenibacillus crassostreae]AOZ93801.1 cytochrome aa3 quinol oxidase subunit II [Paenibacillus crassostreae]OAB77165.1 quinol oxidase subunit 2 [Paenibacillus crassostreae]
MKKRGLLFVLFSSLVLLLSGCSSIAVFDPKGPAARTLSSTILFSIAVMIGILLVVYVLFIVILSKYRAKNSKDDYIPPHEEGNKWLEVIWITIPIIIVTVLSVVTVKSTISVENVPKGYENQKPLVIYAASSNWKWHFSYPEEGIETVNYLNIPTHRPIELRLYSFGPITSFWVPQLAGQKYAMSDMINKLNLVADVPGSYLGRNTNFSGEGSAHMEFETLAMSSEQFTEWVDEVKTTAPALDEEKFTSLLATAHVGRESFSTNHLSFSPAPGDHADHMYHTDMENGNVEHQENKEEHPTPPTSPEETEFDSVPNVDPNEPLPQSPAEDSSGDIEHTDHTNHEGH